MNLSVGAQGIAPLHQQEVEAKRKEAEVHQDEDAITDRLFHLEEELMRLQDLNKEKTSDNWMLESLADLRSAIDNRDVTQAEKLLTEIKSLSQERIS